MEAMPETYEASQIDTKGKYKCPLCDVQTTADEIDTEWVFCPMLDNHPICLGCCLDYQNVARLENFATHPYHSLFDEVSQVARKSTVELRKRCLDHQEEILKTRLGNELEEQTRQEILKLLNTVGLRIKELST